MKPQWRFYWSRPSWWPNVSSATSGTVIARCGQSQGPGYAWIGSLPPGVAGGVGMACWFCSISFIGPDPNIKSGKTIVVTKESTHHVSYVYVCTHVVSRYYLSWTEFVFMLFSVPSPPVPQISWDLGPNFTDPARNHFIPLTSPVCPCQNRPTCSSFSDQSLLMHTSSVHNISHIPLTLWIVVFLSLYFFILPVCRTVIFWVSLLKAFLLHFQRDCQHLAPIPSCPFCPSSAGPDSYVCFGVKGAVCII